MPSNRVVNRTGSKSSKKAAKTNKPFKVYNHKRRRYVRLNVDEPIKFKVFNPPVVDFDLTDKQTSTGLVLNISGGGVLMETEYSVREDDYIVMEISLTDMESVSGIIGKVKRVDDEEKNRPLVGVEFMTPQQLSEEMPQEILDLLGEKLFSFDEKIRKMLLKYVFSHKVEKA